MSKEEMKKYFGIITILSFALLLSGCINYEQETSLNKDWSGHINMHISMDPKTFMCNLFLTAAEKADSEPGSEPKMKPSLQESLSKVTSSIKCDIKEEDILKNFNKGAVKNITFRKEEENGIIHFYFSADFEDITTLYADKNKVSISEGEDGRVTYTERLSSSADGTQESEDADKSHPELFEGYHFQYILHMPRNIISANTDKIDKNTATWYIPMPDVMRQKDFTAVVTIRRVLNE
ncbi:MAG: hypothetical protein Q8R48_08510 [Candidatus Omnitrophota bacterium]|nr:hypothetical protein [Candidatus Omnitrophota bacterium]